MDYVKLIPKKDIIVDGLYSVHYFEYSSTYYFEGESHDFWEFLYVDKGIVSVTSNDQEYTLKKGQIIFHKPKEHHTVKSNGIVAPNLVVCGFSAQGDEMKFFENKILEAADEEKALLARIVEEAGDAFTTPLNDPTTKSLDCNVDAKIGAQQIIAISLEQLLINFLRKDDNNKNQVATGNFIRKHTQKEFVDKIIIYFENNLSKHLTLAEICRDNLVGRSYLQKNFREITGGGAMEYFGKMKVKEAKTMMREGKHNFTEISSILGYNSIHYFSRHFKKVTGMTPSEYTGSIKVLSSK